VSLLVSKARIELNRVDGGIGDNAATTRRRNESFGSRDHFAADSPPLQPRLYREQSQRRGLISEKIDPQRAQEFAILPVPHEMIVR